MKLHIVVMAEFRNNLNCFTFGTKRLALLDVGFSASAVSELRLKQKSETQNEREREFYRTYLQTSLCGTC
jgi:hypothetical protein